MNENIDFLIQKIENFSLERKEVPVNGFFASYRYHNYLPYYRLDDNIFFPSSIAFILMSYLDKLNAEQIQKVEIIIKRIREKYELYENKKENFIYNFYQLKPKAHYPYGKLLHKIEHFKLPEDADDTVIITMTLPVVSKERISKIRKYLVNFSNLKNKKVKGISDEYAILPVYSTWFGSGIMPIEIEICILCNILTFVFKYNLELNGHDIASIEFIQKAIKNKDILHNPIPISGQYPETSVILYHIARLYTFSKEKIEFDKTTLIEIIGKKIAHTKSIFEKILLSISLLKFGHPVEYIKWRELMVDLEKEFKKFPFFTAPMFSGTSNPIYNMLKKYDFFKMHFGSEAFYITLLLEYEVLFRNHR